LPTLKTADVSRITEGENRNFKTSLKQTPITIMMT